MKHYHIGPSALSFASVPENPLIDLDPKNYITEDETIIIQKKWGQESILPNTGSYTAKIMTLVPGTKCSLHMHSEKKESFILISGKMIIEVVNLVDGSTSSVELQKIGESVTLERNVPHSFHCPEDQLGLTVFIECSTKDSPRDSYRFSQSTGPKDSDNR